MTHSTKKDKKAVSKLASKMKKANEAKKAKLPKHTLANQSMRYEINEHKGCVGKSGTHTHCHEFTGSKNASGYGQTNVDGKNQPAHRVAYQHWIGDIPHKYDVSHICHNRKCINPDHLEAVTHADNVRQSIIDNNGRKKPVKLSAEQKKEIYDNRTTSHTELARKYNISLMTITTIIRTHRDMEK